MPGPPDKRSRPRAEVQFIFVLPASPYKKSRPDPPPDPVVSGAPNEKIGTAKTYDDTVAVGALESVVPVGPHDCGGSTQAGGSCLDLGDGRATSITTADVSTDALFRCIHASKVLEITS